MCWFEGSTTFERWDTLLGEDERNQVSKVERVAAGASSGVEVERLPLFITIKQLIERSV